MQALKRFVRNSGLPNSIKFLFVLVLLYFAIARDVRSGLAVVTLPLALFGIFGPRMIRDWLIDHFEIVRTVMNVFVLICLVALAVVGRSKSTEPDSLRIVLCLAFSLYIGVYFWVLSDDRIQRP